MNRNKPEKLARIELRVKPKDKERIVKTANQCGLSYNIKEIHYGHFKEEYL